MVVMEDFAKFGEQFGGSVVAAETAHFRVILLDTPCQVVFGVSHRKQTIGAHLTRHTFRGSMRVKIAASFSRAFAVPAISGRKSSGFRDAAANTKRHHRIANEVAAGRRFR